MPKEVMRIIVKNYYKNRKPEKMITWWWREARQVADRQPNAAPSEDQARETGLSMPTRLPANSRMTKSKKAFSRTRFANLIRRNSIQLKTKGTVLIFMSMRNIRLLSIQMVRKNIASRALAQLTTPWPETIQIMSQTTYKKGQ